MGKANRPAWAQRLLDLLEQAKAADPKLKRFGARSHRYRLSAPAGEEAVAAFEEEFHVQLPEEYRDFLTLVGDGGAGPYFGLFGLKKIKKALRDSELYDVQGEVLLDPEMGAEDWKKLADWKDDEEEAPLYAGVLPIESQGDTFMTGLVLTGPYRGQVVYYDEDCYRKPFFVREKGFLAWYERWLREVIAGYEDPETGFGLNLDGDPEELAQLYEQAQASRDKLEVIRSFYKFQELPEAQRDYFGQVCARESDVVVRAELIEMLLRFRAPQAEILLEKLWEDGNSQEVLSIIHYKGTRQLKRAWCERIFERLPALRGDALRFACYVFTDLENDPKVCAERFLDVLGREDLSKDERANLFSCIGELKGKEAVLEYFLSDLPAEKDLDLLNYGILAMNGVRDPRLLKLYVQLLDRYRGCENAQQDFKGSQGLLLDGVCMGSSTPEGDVISNLLDAFELFGLDYQGAWKLLMDDRHWAQWKQENGFIGE